MSALKRLFNKKINQCSPLCDDFTRVVKRDENGREYNTYVKTDLVKVQQSLGDVRDWSLDALLKAGVNPDFSIHTGLNTRIEGVNVVNDAMDYVASLLDNSEDLPADDNQ